MAALILLMKYAENLSHKEIAVILDITETASRKRLSRAIKSMRNNEKIRKYRTFIVLLIILFAILTACAIKPVRDFLVDVFHEFTYFRKENVETADMFAFEEITFGFVPEGYTCTKESSSRTNFFIFHSADKSDFTVLFESGRTKSNKNINSEGGHTEIIDINGLDCFVTCSSETPEVIAVIYLKGGAIEYVGELEQSEMIKLLESINLLKEKEIET